MPISILALLYIDKGNSMKKLLKTGLLLILIFIHTAYLNTSSQDTSSDEIFLNFENASLLSVVQYLAEQKNLDLITHKDLENKKVSLSTRTPLNLDQAWEILLTLIEANGFTIINVNDLYRIVPSNEKNNNPITSYVDTDYKKLPDSDEVIRYVYIFKNATHNKIMPIITKLIPSSNIKHMEKIQTLMITDKSRNIKTAMEIITELDDVGLRESIQIIQIKNASASHIADVLNGAISDKDKAPRAINMIFQIQDKNKSNYLKSDTKIVPNERNNTLILLGTEKNLKRIKDFIYKYMDIPLESTQSRIHIKELKYIDAETIEPLLTKLTAPYKSDGKAGPIVGDTKYFEDMVIVSEDTGRGDISDTEAKVKADDKNKTATPTESKKAIESLSSGNRLLIACNLEDWKRIEKFINKLDKPQPQVAIEVLFVDISLQDSKKLGAQIRNKAGVLGKHFDGQTQHILSTVSPEVTAGDGGKASGDNVRDNLVQTVVNNSTALADNRTLLTLGKESNIHTIVQTILKDTNSTIISQPYLVARNNQACKIEKSSSKILPAEQSDKNVRAMRSNKPIEAKTSVQITPRINSEGTITLQINISINEWITSTATSEYARTDRNLETIATMMEGEVLIIGGLIKSTGSDECRKTPGLSKIPIIGNLFKYNSKTKETADLYIFIRPTLIKPAFQGKPGNYTQLKIDYANISVKRHEDLIKNTDPIQKWFFNGSKDEKIQTLENATSGFKQIENFIQGKEKPSSVILPIDPYYRPNNKTINNKPKKFKRKSNKR